MGIDLRDVDQPIGHAVRWRAAVRRDRPGGVLRRQGADPGRAHRRARRQAVRRGAEVHRPGPRPRPRRHLHHPQPAPRLPGRRPLPAAEARQDARVLQEGRDHPGRTHRADGRRRRARGAAATSSSRAAVRSPRRRRCCRKRCRNSASPNGPPPPDLTVPPPGRGGGGTARRPTHLEGPHLMSTSPSSGPRLALGSCPDSWGVWFADDPLQTPWQRFLDELAGVGYQLDRARPVRLPADRPRPADRRARAAWAEGLAGTAVGAPLHGRRGMAGHPRRRPARWRS